jgi:hypothetical protein
MDPAGVPEHVPNRHPEQEPRFVLLVSFYWTTSPKGKQEISLDNFNRLVALRGNAECELLGQIRKFGV